MLFGFNRKDYINELAATFILISLTILILFACEKLEYERVVKLETGYVSDTTTGSALVTGIIMDAGENGFIKHHGHYWSIIEPPKNSYKDQTDFGATNERREFKSILSNLLQNTKYYVQSYATNGVDTSFGNVITFQTNAGLPVFGWINYSMVTETGATANANIADDGGSGVTDRGFHWSTDTSFSFLIGYHNSGSGIGDFSYMITMLSPNTTYYVRAYATNGIGTIFSTQASFTTKNIFPPTVTTTSVTSVTTTTARSGGNVTSNGGATVTTRGVCWSTSQNPTTADSKTTDGAGTGTYTISLLNLSPITTYYVRAYATNMEGTSYGLQYSLFTLWDNSTISDYDGNVYSTVQIGEQIWMADNLKTTRYNDGTGIPLETDNTAWSNLSIPAYCLYDNNEATYKNLYGALYNWYTVNAGNLCPTGWHVPTDAEWTTLTDYLGGESVAGGKLKETVTTHWYSPNSGATNESGFTALPGGLRFYSNGYYSDFGYHGYWWSSTETSTSDAWSWHVWYSGADVYRDHVNKRNGFSVRCLRNY